MRLKCKQPPVDIDIWHPWERYFVLLPVLVGKEGDAKWLWLCFAERRYQMTGNYGSYYKWWDYRELNEQKGEEL